MVKNGGNKKILIVVILAIAVIVGAIIFKVITNLSLYYELEQVKQVNYLLMCEDGKYGVIDRSGNTIIEAKYEDIQIPNPEKPLFVCLDNYNEATSEYTTTILNEKGERILYQYVSVEGIYIGTATSEFPYEKSVLKYKENGKWGLINFDGKKITKPIYEEISGLEYKEGQLLVKKDNKFGVINIKGATIIKNKYDSIKCDGYYSDNEHYKIAGYIIANKTNEGYRYGYINNKGKLILKPEYIELDRILEKKDDKNSYFVAFKNGRAGLIKNNKVILDYEYDDIFYNAENDLLIVQKNSQQGVMDMSTNSILPIKYTNILFAGKYINAQTDSNVEIFNAKGEKQNNDNYISITQADNDDYFIVITKDGLYQILDKNNNIITKNEYTYISHIKDNYFIATQNEKTGIINSREDSIVDFKYDIIQIVAGTNLVQGLILKDSTTDLYDFAINKLTSMKKANIYLKDNFVQLFNENTVEYFNKDGKKMKNTEIYNNDLYAQRQNNKWGFSDKEGNIKVKATYEMVTEFNEYGYAGVKQNGKWGVINTQGTIVLEPTYTITECLPEFVGKYYKVDLGYGEPYFTNQSQINY